MNTQRLITVFLLSIIPFTLQARAENNNNSTRYVVDTLYVTLRENPQPGSTKVARGIASGSLLNFIQEDETGTYSLVETQKGKKGWVQNQYIQINPTAALAVLELNKQIKLLSQKSDTALLADLEKTKKENKSLNRKNNQLNNELKEIKHASANVIKINNSNHALIEKNQLLQSKVDGLEAVSAQYKNNRSMTFLIYGGLLVFFTIILMLIYDGVKRRRSFGSDW